jgi:hypothetical protein
MEIFLDTHEHPDVSPEQRAWSELIKLVRKLRWIGMEEEARQMRIELQRVYPAATLLTGPFDTTELFRIER